MFFRYIGKVRANIESECSGVRAFLLIEAIARVLKNLIRSRLREKMRHIKLVGEAPYKAEGKNDTLSFAY